MCKTLNHFKLKFYEEVFHVQKHVLIYLMHMLVEHLKGYDNLFPNLITLHLNFPWAYQLTLCSTKENFPNLSILFPLFIQLIIEITIYYYAKALHMHQTYITNVVFF